MTGSSTAGFGPWSFGISPMERLARLRALRALAMLICGGPAHPLYVELLAAELDVAALPRALDQLGRLPALPAPAPRELRVARCRFAFSAPRRARAASPPRRRRPSMTTRPCIAAVLPEPVWRADGPASTFSSRNMMVIDLPAEQRRRRAADRASSLIMPEARA
jgi:hypothetical protein